MHDTLPENTNFSQFSKYSSSNQINQDNNKNSPLPAPSPRPVLSLPRHSNYSIIGYYIDLNQDMIIIIDLGDYRRTVKIFPETDYDNVYYDGTHIMYVYEHHVVTNFSGIFRDLNDSVGFSNTIPSSFGQ